jgi:hypothetical protein
MTIANVANILIGLVGLVAIPVLLGVIAYLTTRHVMVVSILAALLLIMAIVVIIFAVETGVWWRAGLYGALSLIFTYGLCRRWAQWETARALILIVKMSRGLPSGGAAAAPRRHGRAWPCRPCPSLLQAAKTRMAWKATQ